MTQRANTKAKLTFFPGAKLAEKFGNDVRELEKVFASHELLGDKRKASREKLKEAIEQHPAWSERLPMLHQRAAYVKEQVEAICQGTSFVETSASIDTDS